MKTLILTAVLLSSAAFADNYDPYQPYDSTQPYPVRRPEPLPRFDPYPPAVVVAPIEPSIRGPSYYGTHSIMTDKQYCSRGYDGSMSCMSH